MTPILECQSLTKKFSNDHYALLDTNLILERGQIIGLLGPNGSGKTTLIKLISGLLTPTDGTVLIDGKKPSPKTKKIVSYLPDRNYLNGKMTVEKVIDQFTDFYNDFDAKRAYDMFIQLNIDPFQKINTFSKGTKEKIQLILVMSRDADLYVLDEPIGGVDPTARDYIIHTILANYNPEATIIITTHLIADIEDILDRVVFIRNGAILVNASTENIRTEKEMTVVELYKEVFKC